MADEARPVLLKDQGEPIFPMTHKDLVQGLDDALAAKQALLVSGVNIKTINGQSILGSGNIAAGGGVSARVEGTKLIITSATARVEGTKLIL